MASTLALKIDNGQRLRSFAALVDFLAFSAGKERLVISALPHGLQFHHRHTKKSTSKTVCLVSHLFFSDYSLKKLKNSPPFLFSFDKFWRILDFLRNFRSRWPNKLLRL
jgi:hypothetical protein